MSPFGEYSSFEDCVSKNKDKDDPEAYCAVIKRKIESQNQVDPKELKKESKEHPSLPEKTVKHIVLDHMKKQKKAKLKSIWKTAKMSGLGQIPVDYKKKLDNQTAKYGKLISHGNVLIFKTAQHQKFDMKEYAELKIAFLREGDFRTNGVPYHYDWETVERDGKTFEGKYLYANHSDEDYTLQIGEIKDTYPERIDGENWLCATIYLPEIQLNNNILDRIETGLIKEVSSTHDFYVYPDDSNHKVKKLNGKAISLVSAGEVEGNKIISLRRHIKGGTS